MPWNVSGIVKQRKGFLEELESGYYTMKECCERYGISRQAGYKVLGKYREYGEAGLVENSRAPHNHPNQTPVEMEEPLLLGSPGKRYKVVPVPQRKADTVAVAAGALLGVTASVLLSQLGKAARSLRR